MRSPEGLRSQYNIERELANRLRLASRTDGRSCIQPFMTSFSDVCQIVLRSRAN